jgi:ATP-dependent RNA helicase DeaD
MSETTPETSPTDVDETTSTTGTDDGVHAETRDDAGEGEPKKRRRRRRGGRGRKRGKRTGEAGGEPAAESADAPEAGEAAAVDADAEPREDVEPRDPEPRRDDRREDGEASDGDRSRKGRRRRRGGKGPRRGDDDGEDDRARDDGDRGPTPRKRPTPEVLQNWEEIFEEQTFADLGIRNSVVKGAEAVGFRHPTKIQAELIPLVLEGKDVLGQSRTGTGKTAAFGLPLFNLLERDKAFQALILAPTRELAIQIRDELAELGRFTPIKIVAVYGGQRIQTQAARLEAGPQIIVATPGRLMDMVQRGHMHFDNVRIVVLDEVDRMLDIGFREDIQKILSRIRTEHQTVFVSATIGDDIEKLARKFMSDPVRLETTGSSLTVSLVEQHYISIQPWDKRRMLHHLLTHEEPDTTLVFCRMKRTVDQVAEYLNRKGIDAHAIHGDMYQGKRNSVIRKLREGELSVMIASDVAARGLDVEGITHVINYDVPEDPEIYVHRIGRTARAGRDGVAWSLVTPEQGALLTAIEKLANIHIPEKAYPDFKPGEPPQNIRMEKEREAARREELASKNRYRAPEEPTVEAKDKADASKFPGGIVPTKLPPRRMGGRVSSRRGK